MSKGVKFGLLFLILAIVGIAIIDAGAKRPINWTKNYSFKEKSPYGLFVFREELNHILGNDRVVSSFGESLYEMIDSLHGKDVSNMAILDIYGYSYMDDLETSSLLNFVDRGGEVFISSLDFGEDLLDSLGIQVEVLNYSRFNLDSESVTYSLGHDTAMVMLDRVDDFKIFSKLNAGTCTILGNVHANGYTIPNFIKVKYGKGSFYLHTLPEVFTNYYMLNRDSYYYVSRILNLLQHKELLLHDYYDEEYIPTTPLRVILTKPGFAEAWYILLFCLIVLFVFKSKREQRAVQVIQAEPNLSKEFAKTIANVYYENGNPENIIHKKIEYFLFAIRQAYQVDTMDLLDEKLISQLSAKAMVSREETYALLKLLASCRLRDNFNIQEVKVVNNRIEDFKNKANI